MLRRAKPSAEPRTRTAFATFQAPRDLDIAPPQHDDHAPTEDREDQQRGEEPRVEGRGDRLDLVKGRHADRCVGARRGGRCQ